MTPTRNRICLQQTSLSASQKFLCKQVTAGFRFLWRGTLRYCCISFVLFAVMGTAHAQNQTSTFSPVTRWDGNYRIEVKARPMGSVLMPGLQSFASGQVGDQWVIVAGKTGGMHSFTTGNRSAWVIDPVSKQVWSRSLDDPLSGLSQHTVNGLSSSNPQAYQRGNTLFVTGGYVYETTNDKFTTYNDLTAIDLPELIDWVKSPGSQMQSNTILQAAGGLGDGTDYEGGLFQVTGGGMYEINGKTHIVFGQMFEGPYDPSQSYQKYTSQVRSFEIDYDHAAGALGYDSSTVSPAGGDPTQFRRRDLNTFQVLSKDTQGDDVMSGVALSGVFFEGEGIWTVPVEISADGVPSMVDPTTDPTVFKQAMNGYECAKLGLYSSDLGEMTEILFGGITANEFIDDPASGNLRYDEKFPFTNQISAVSIASDGTYSQSYLGDFPDVISPQGTPYLFGSNAEFFVSSDLSSLLEGDIIDVDALSERTQLGFIYGGIAAATPHGGFGGDSIASSQVFDVWYQPVPEPSTLLVWSILGAVGLMLRRFRGALRFMPSHVGRER